MKLRDLSPPTLYPPPTRRFSLSNVPPLPRYMSLSLTLHNQLIQVVRELRNLEHECTIREIALFLQNLATKITLRMLSECF